MAQNDVNISFRVPKEMDDQLRELAQKARRTKSNYIRLQLEAVCQRAGK